MRRANMKSILVLSLFTLLSTGLPGLFFNSVFATSVFDDAVELTSTLNIHQYDVTYTWQDIAKDTCTDEPTGFLGNSGNYSVAQYADYYISIAWSPSTDTNAKMEFTERTTPYSERYVSLKNSPNAYYADIVLYNGEFYCNSGFLSGPYTSNDTSGPGGTKPYKAFFSTYPVVYPDGYQGYYIPSSTPPANYVAMGDSYSSGEGNLPYEYGSDTSANVCHRSSVAYPRILQDELNLGSTAFVACSGAVSDYIINSYNLENVEVPQANYLSEDTDIVTISIGGNDIGFASTLKACTLSTQVDEEAECLDAVEDSYDIATSSAFEDKMFDTFEGIRDLAGINTQIFVLGYPNLFPEYQNISGTCTWGNGLFGTSGRAVSQNEVVASRQLQAELNGVLETAVDDLNDGNVHFVDPTVEFDSHTLCTSTPWINGVQFHFSTSEFGSDSYHPNNLGHAAFAELIEDEIGSSI